MIPTPVGCEIWPLHSVSLNQIALRAERTMETAPVPVLGNIPLITQLLLVIGSMQLYYKSLIKACPLLKQPWADPPTMNPTQSRSPRLSRTVGTFVLLNTK